MRFKTQSAASLRPRFPNTLPVQAPEKRRSVYELTLPLPPKECSPNSRCHWARKARAVKAYRAACCKVFYEARIPTFQNPIEVHLTFFLCREKASANEYLPRDADNARASFKAGMDALQDAGIIKSDSAANVKMGETILRTKAKGKPETRHFGETGVQIKIIEATP